MSDTTQPPMHALMRWWCRLWPWPQDVGLLATASASRLGQARAHVHCSGVKDRSTADTCTAEMVVTEAASWCYPADTACTRHMHHIRISLQQSAAALVQRLPAGLLHHDAWGLLATHQHVAMQPLCVYMCRSASLRLHCL